MSLVAAYRTPSPFMIGYDFPRAILRVVLAVCQLTEYIMKLLIEKGYSFSTTAEREMVRDVKENSSYIALDFDSKPSFVEKEFSRIHDTTFQSIVECDVDIKRISAQTWCSQEALPCSPALVTG